MNIIEFGHGELMVSNYRNEEGEYCISIRKSKVKRTVGLSVSKDSVPPPDAATDDVTLKFATLDGARVLQDVLGLVCVNMGKNKGVGYQKVGTWIIGGDNEAL